MIAAKDAGFTGSSCLHKYVNTYVVIWIFTLKLMLMLVGDWLRSSGAPPIASTVRCLDLLRVKALPYPTLMLALT